MKALIGGSLAGSKRVTGLIKLAICMAVIIGLASTGSASAVSTITLDADSLTAGIYGWGTSTLTWTTALGDVTFKGEILPVDLTYGDTDLNSATSAVNGENTFDIVGPQDVTGGDRTAELFFDFNVLSVEFYYGGNDGDITVEIQDIYGNTIGTPFSQSSTDDGDPVGPVTLSGAGIRSLWWYDSGTDEDYASLDNIVITVPAPSTLALTGIGIGLVGRLRKRKIA